MVSWSAFRFSVAVFPLRLDRGDCLLRSGEKVAVGRMRCGAPTASSAPRVRYRIRRPAFPLPAPRSLPFAPMRQIFFQLFSFAKTTILFVCVRVYALPCITSCGTPVGPLENHATTFPTAARVSVRYRSARCINFPLRLGRGEGSRVRCRIADPCPLTAEL